MTTPSQSQAQPVVTYQVIDAQYRGGMFRCNIAAVNARGDVIASYGIVVAHDATDTELDAAVQTALNNLPANDMAARVRDSLTRVLAASP